MKYAKLLILFLLIILILSLALSIETNLENFESNSDIKFVMDKGLWEFDYLKNDLFRDYVDFDKNLVSLANEEFSKLLDDEYDYLIDNCVLTLCATVVPLETAIKIVKKVKPKCIIILSDEFGDLKDWMVLAEHTKLILRQHNHPGYEAKSYDNVIHIPLGYVNTYLSNKSALDIETKKTKDRKYTCAFIGVMKQDRQHMTDLFEKNIPDTFIKRTSNNWNIKDLPFSPPDTFMIYSDTIFILNGRGNSSVDCFRIYEALAAGAIPVIVCNKNELERVFYYNDDILPPFVFAENWDDALAQCKGLLENPEKLQNKQDANIQWWKNKITEIRKKIKDVL